MGRLGRLLRLLPDWGRTAWWGLVGARLEREPLVVHQAVVLHEGRVLLGLRADVRGWELPGGSAHPGESGEDAVAREVLEETGVEVVVERRVGDYVRSGFRPHTARVWHCAVRGGVARPSPETLEVRWYPADAPPDALLPWYRRPLADAVSDLAEPVVCRERWGLREIWNAAVIDLRSRVRETL